MSNEPVVIEIIKLSLVFETINVDIENISDDEIRSVGNGGWKWNRADVFEFALCFIHYPLGKKIIYLPPAME